MSRTILGIALAGLFAASPIMANAAAPGGEQHPRAAHLDNETGGSPTPHVPAAGQNRADGGGGAAHLHNDGGGEVASHRPGGEPSAPSSAGGAVVLDNEPGGGPAPRRAGRGPS